MLKSGCLELLLAIGSDEPVFIVRAQDRSAPATMRFWAEENHRNGGDVALSELAEAHADAMEEWQRTHSNNPTDLTPNAKVRGAP